MTVARAVGLRTEGQLRYQDDTLFIPRFDRRIRDGKVLRLHQESAASLAGIVGFEATPSQFDLLQALRAVVSDKTMTAATSFFIFMLSSFELQHLHRHQAYPQILCASLWITFAPPYLYCLAVPCSSVEQHLASGGNPQSGD